MKLSPLFLSFGLLAACAGGNGAEAKDAPVRRKAPEILELIALRLPRTQSYVGTFIAPRDAVVSATRGGRVEQYLAEVGSSVTRGDVLVTLGATELGFAAQAAAASVKQARARIGNAREAASMPSAVAAKSNYVLAQDARTRAEKLYKSGSQSEQDLRRAQASEQAAKAQFEEALAQAEAEFGRLSELEATSAQARTVVGDQRIVAPFDGVVLERFVRVGQMVAPSSPLVRIFDPSDLLVRFEVPQFDAAKVTIGSKFSLLIEGRPIAGSVVRTTPGLVGESNTRMVEGKLELEGVEDNKSAILPGARHVLWLEVGGEDEVVELPRSATTSNAGLVRAWVLEGAHLRERLLSVLRAEEDRLFVSKGLSSGERLVRFPKQDFRVGEEVAP